LLNQSVFLSDKPLPKNSEPISSQRPLHTLSSSLVVPIRHRQATRTKVRVALNLVVDKQAIIQRVLGG
jgi:hypothetical protein